MRAIQVEGIKCNPVQCLPIFKAKHAAPGEQLGKQFIGPSMYLRRDAGKAIRCRRGGHAGHGTAAYVFSGEFSRDILSASDIMMWYC
jgi:hypothetical protein